MESFFEKRKMRVLQRLEINTCRLKNLEFMRIQSFYMLEKLTITDKKFTEGSESASGEEGSVDVAET